MAEEDTPQTNGAADAAAAPPQVKQRVLAQFVRDLSFENVMSQKGVDGAMMRCKPGQNGPMIWTS